MFRNIREILSDASEKIIARGEVYYEDGMILSAQNTDENTIEAQVLGSADFPYTVEIDTDGSDTITDCFCDCPYDYGDVCKHIVAVLLMLEEEGACVNAPTATEHPSAQQVLDSLNEQQMREFLRSRIAADKALAKALCDQYTKPDANRELASIRQALRQLCQQAEESWGNRQMVQMLYDKMYMHAEQARLRLSQGHHLLAAQIALEVLKACFRMIEAIFIAS